MNLLISDPDLKKSAQALDDARLIKQILECYQICKINEEFLSGNTQIGYRNHPVVVYYRDKPELVVDFGAACCVEYLNRFKETHAYFASLCEKRLYIKIKNAKRLNKNILDYINKDSDITPIYVEGSYSIVDSTVYDLFKNKLNEKWFHGKAVPRWKNSTPPEWMSELAKFRYEHEPLTKRLTKNKV